MLRSLLLTSIAMNSLQSLASEIPKPTPAESAKISPQFLVDRVLNYGFEAQQIRHKEKLAHLEFATPMSAYDSTLSAKSEYTNDRVTSIAPSANDEQTDLKLEVKGSKPLPTGTTLEAGYTRHSQSRVQNSFAKNFGSSPDRETLDTLSVQIQQDLWKNAFGSQNRKALAAVNKRLSILEMQRLEDLEALIVESMEKFWETYVAKVELQHRIDARDRYLKLVKIVKNKSRLGFTNPGELSQAQAELEDQQQKVKQSSSSYLSLLDDLFRRLQLDLSGTAKATFEVGELLPPIPKLDVTNVDGLRPMLIAGQELSARKLDAHAKSSEHHPQLSLTGKAGYKGLDEEPSKANSRVFSFDRPTYYLGLEFSYSLDSEKRKVEVQNSNVKVMEGEVILANNKRILVNELRTQERLVKSLFLVAKSAIEAEKFRKKAVKEQERAYKQGRTDINILIQIFNALLTTQTQRVQAIGQYHIALNKLAATRDELIRVSTTPAKGAGS